MYIENVE